MLARNPKSLFMKKFLYNQGNINQNFPFITKVGAHHFQAENNGW
jgi:hypothetical protein